MNVVLKTVYENVDQKWLDWYLGRLRQVPDLIHIAEELKLHGTAVLSNKDPASHVVATTTYDIED